MRAHCNRASIILFNIDALTSAASSARSDATANEGRVNYDASDVPIEARAAPTTGSGCHGWVMAVQRRVVEYSFLSIMRAHSDGSSANPPLRAIEGSGVTCGVLGGRWASLVGEVTLPCARRRY